MVESIKPRHLALQISYYAGLRAKEISNLLISDIYLSTGAVKSIVDLKANQTKGKQGRSFPISQKLKIILQNYYVEMNLANTDRTNPLLRSQKGKAITPNSMCSILIKIYEDAGLEGCTSHSGRRSYGVALADKGVGLHLLKSLLGHKNISTTLLYTQATPNSLMNAVDLI